MNAMRHLLWIFASFSMIAHTGDEAAWDVADPPDETYTINLDVDEGTWLSVDVSPDGEDIVFDLLGDIYIMPIGGGDAKLLAGGLPWEMQPRFSPDGKRIAYTSDRGGGDNIWVMDRDGDNPTQLTKESFRLLNNPVWTPDGQYIAARKHFTKSRSLGAGEIWLYHHTGGKGMQMIKKPNDQKDLGEPAFSADGEHLYYSQDITPGPIFQYSKDPTPGIYAVKRLDRTTGEVETYLSGLGGAIRPTPSPDGKYLAFIRRNDYQTTLYLHDFESGRNWPVYDKLDRDMQETWAIHGVYANISWTPDAKSLVFWAGGKINHLDIATKEAKVIPFRVKTKHTMIKTLRVPTEVAPDQFDVKMLRWTNVSPKGDKVIYTALGHIYIRNLPDGEPKRLTTQNDHFEYYPSFSRDGQSIVYISWHDQDLGAVRVIPASGGDSRVLTTQKGHYIAPTFSPSGEHIVYSRVGGGYVRTPLYSNNTGLYVIPVKGGEAKRISKRGVEPHFGADDNRVFFLTVGAESRRTLRSVGLHGYEPREHLTSSEAGEMRVSPDGQWIAFTEPFHVRLAPFPRIGQAVNMTPAGGNVPVVKVSAEAGNYLHWSGDGQRLYWSLGDRLHHRDLNQSFAYLKGAPEDMPEPEAQDAGQPIGFSTAYAKPDTTIALTGARIITMNGDEIIERGDILITGNRITTIGPSGSADIPRGAKTVDLAGKTIIPGFVDVHDHGPYGSDEIVPQQNWSHYAGLTFGVTTIHDPSTDTSTVFSAAEMAKAGLILAPRIYSTGTILYGASLPQYTSKVDSIDDARFHVRRLKAAGAITVKSYNQPRRDQRQQIMKAGREEGIMVLPEGGSLFQHNMTMIADGHTGIEHSIPVAKAYDDVIQFWGRSGTYYTPTLVVGYGGIWGENYWYAESDVWRHPRLSQYVPDYILEPRSRRREIAPDHEYNHIDNARICKQLVDAGVHVMLGAHGQREGLAAHWELWMFVQGGMTPHEALRSATYSGAKYLGMEGDVGSLAQGKLADLVILDANPLDDIRNSEKISHVMLNGRLFDAMTMNEVDGPERKPFFFEGMDSGAMSVNKTMAGCGTSCRSAH